MQMSISSGEMVRETTTIGGVVATEANAAAVVLHSADNPTLRQGVIHRATHPLPQLLQLEHAAGIVASETKV